MMTTDFNDIVQWNLTSYRAQFEELKVLLKENNAPACICLQETRHGDSRLYPPSQYTSIYSAKQRNDDHERGVAILINKKINYKEINLQTPDNIEAVAARVWMGRYYTICSVYLSPSLAVQERDLLNLIRQLPKPFLLLGDMNARHASWGEPVNNDKGLTIESLLINEDISLINDTDKTHYSFQHGTRTLIDLSIASIDCHADFSHTVMENLHGSDHHPIKISKTPDHRNFQPSLRFKTEKADWNKFKQLTALNDSLISTNGIDDHVESITSLIIDAATASIPVSFGRRGGKIPVPWFNEECKNINQQRKRAERALDRNNNLGNKIALRRLNAMCRNTFKKAKREAWEDYVSSINVNTTVGAMWKKINKIRGKFSVSPPPLLTNSAGELTDDPEETSNMFAEVFSDVSSEETYSVSFLRRKRNIEKFPLNFNRARSEEISYNQPFSKIEFDNALSTVKDSSPGLDQITYSMIKNADQSLQQKILELFNRIYAESTFPSPWKIAVVIPIPKPNKDHSNPTNYRPISLTSCLCKLMEKMVNLRLTWYLEKERCLSGTQSGFRQGRSTTDCLVQVSNDVQKAIIENKHTLVVYFDIMKAYDTAWKRGILNRLVDFGLCGNLPKYLQQFLCSRQIRVKVGSTYSHTQSTDEGVPQGSVLSCTLFAIAMDSIIQKLRTTQVKACLYVDDLTIYASGSMNTAERQIKTAIKKIEEWSKETGFQFSAAKTVSMHICRHRSHDGTWCLKKKPEITLYGTEIECKESHTYLGLRMDSSLRWHKHVEYLRSECQRRLNILKHVSHTNWGADSKSIIRLYTAFIKTKIEYGVEAYGSSCASTLAKLDPIQNAALRTATGAYRTSPVESLEVLTGVKPLQDARKERTAIYITRVLANPSNPLAAMYQEACQQESLDVAMTKFQQNSIFQQSKSLATVYGIEEESIWKEHAPDYPPWELGGISSCQDIMQIAKRDVNPNILKINFTAHIQSHDHSHFTAYTDGSKTESGVAYAFTASHANQPSISESVKMHDASSIFSAELHAILAALTKGIETTADRTLIFTDSKSSIQAVTKPFSKNPIVIEIQGKVHRASHRLHLCWIPSHVGLGGNEQADRLANAGTEDNIQSMNRLTRGELRAKIKRTTKETWKQRWKAPRLRPNKLRDITDNLSPLPNTVCKNRRWERTLARLRLGHSPLTHGFLITRAAPPTCENCGEDTRLTIKHILVECPGYRAPRLAAFGRTTVTMTDLLNTGDTSVGGSLYKFLYNINTLPLI